MSSARHPKSTTTRSGVAAASAASSSSTLLVQRAVAHIYGNRLPLHVSLVEEWCVAAQLEEKKGEWDGDDTMGQRGAGKMNKMGAGTKQRIHKEGGVCGGGRDMVLDAEAGQLVLRDAAVRLLTLLLGKQQRSAATEDISGCDGGKEKEKRFPTTMAAAPPSPPFALLSISVSMESTTIEGGGVLVEEVARAIPLHLLISDSGTALPSPSSSSLSSSSSISCLWLFEGERPAKGDVALMPPPPPPSADITVVSSLRSDEEEDGESSKRKFPPSLAPESGVAASSFTFPPSMPCAAALPPPPPVLLLAAFNHSLRDVMLARRVNALAIFDYFNNVSNAVVEGEEGRQSTVMVRRRFAANNSFALLPSINGLPVELFAYQWAGVRGGGEGEAMVGGGRADEGTIESLAASIVSSSSESGRLSAGEGVGGVAIALPSSANAMGGVDSSSSSAAVAVAPTATGASPNRVSATGRKRDRSPMEAQPQHPLPPLPLPPQQHHVKAKGDSAHTWGTAKVGASAVAAKSAAATAPHNVSIGSAGKERSLESFFGVAAARKASTGTAASPPPPRFSLPSSAAAVVVRNRSATPLPPRNDNGPRHQNALPPPPPLPSTVSRGRSHQRNTTATTAHHHSTASNSNVVAVDVDDDACDVKNTSVVRKRKSGKGDADDDVADDADDVLVID